MITRQFLVALSRMNALLPEQMYWVYGDTEIIEISTDIEASIELTSGARFNAVNIDIEKLSLYSTALASSHRATSPSKSIGVS
ncbi:hypothetical protein [Alteromonas stellipolaris]|uniref:hypothetical protein n=1 Tax=Alteromonas stellipolaris TaxID=233316 RepID=UPI0026E34C08|nr:hypothetical protein [Alteromonas stellipolaris]MDO6536246.1 hypothetical protein [Alteromonas stellipolaris]MDO6627781.1 hypothetical protein [Alteromonas stellipolaris]